MIFKRKIPFRLLHIVSLLLVRSLLFSQTINLSLNGSFEDYFFLPENFTQVKQKNTEFIPKWVFLSTPDYFNKKNKHRVVGLPKNFAGSISPENGGACAGIILRADPVNYTLSPKYTEHIQNQLSDTMKKNQLYCVKMYVSFANNSGFASDGLGMYFSNNKIIFKQKDDILLYKPQIEDYPGNIMMAKNQWVLFSGIYKANGGEKYVTIGSFRAIEDLNMVRIRARLRKRMHFFSYYYIDNVFISPIRDTSECQCTAWSKTLDPKFKNKTYLPQDTIDFVSKNEYFGTVVYDKPFRLNNVYFNFDKTDLLPESNQELDKLYDLLKSLKKVRVTILGHTDSMGTEAYNKALSENRALSVQEYLLDKGFDPQYIKAIGYGFAKPVAPNATPEGRKLNRRVEFILQRVYTKEDEE
jgi:outer membrane protein OmpA-like peptidoglycan-associated protein